MREAPSIRLIDELKQRGAKVQAYDPQAMNMAKSFYLKDVEVEYINNKYDALNDVDALVIVTEWKEFQSPDFMEIAARMKGNDILMDEIFIKQNSKKSWLKLLSNWCTKINIMLK